MSQENVEVVRALWVGWERGDFRVGLEHYDTEVDFVLDIGMPTPLRSRLQRPPVHAASTSCPARTPSSCRHVTGQAPTGERMELVLTPAFWVRRQGDPRPDLHQPRAVSEELPATP